VVEKRPIRMGRLVDGLRVMVEGVQPGEWVVVNGLQRARPGAKVDPEQTDMNTLTASALKAAAEARKDKATTAAAPPEGGDSQPAEKADKN